MGAPKLKVLTDENVPRLVCDWLSSLRRIDLLTARDAGLLNREDESLIQHAAASGRVFLAADKVFAEHNFPVCTHRGIINVAKLNNKPWTCKERLSQVLRKSRRFMNHNVVHLGQDQYWVVQAGGKKTFFTYL